MSLAGASAVEGRVHASGRNPSPAAARGAHGVVVARAWGGQGGATALARGAAGHGERQVCVCVCEDGAIHMPTIIDLAYEPVNQL